MAIAIDRIKCWQLMLGVALVFFGGLYLTAAWQSNDSGSAEVEALRSHPAMMFIAISLPVLLMEGLLWTIAAVELAAAYLGSPALGAVIGFLIYAVVLHWQGGLFAIFDAGWIALILNAGYLLLRQRSKVLAVAEVCLLKTGYLVLAALQIYGI